MDYKKKWRERTRKWAISYLGNCCAICGATDLLEFDHINPYSKSFDISVGIRDGYGLNRLKNELSKCQLLCDKHHYEKTHKDGKHTGGYNKIIDPQHGTAILYGTGCRCDICRNWKRLYRNKIVNSIGIQI